MSNEHDGHIDRLLTAIHRRDETAASPGCLDAETLAAWMDGQLGGPMLAHAEAHAAGCARCQSLLAAMARTAAAGIEAQAGEAGPRWRFWPGIRWAAPLAAAATAAALYVGVRPEGPPATVRNRPASASPNEQLAQRAAEARLAAPAGQSAESADALRKQPPPTEMRARSDQAGERVQKQLDQGAAGAASNEGEKKAEKDTARRRLDDTVVLPPVGAIQPAPTVPDPALGEVGAKAKPQSPPPQPRMESSRTATAAFEDPAKAARGASARLVGGGPVLIATPDPAIRWRILAGTVVQFSSDRGVTWTAQDLGPVGPLTAGAAPAPAVCWIVGRSGTVLLTTDGRTWQRLTFPEPADLAGIIAKDASTATVTTADGRTFATTDGGRTWR